MAKRHNIIKGGSAYNNIDKFSGSAFGVSESSIENLSLSESSGVFTLDYDYTSEPNEPPIINDAYITGTLTDGETLSLVIDAETRSVEALSTGDYTYQWYRSDNKDGLNRAAISGATSSTYTLTGSDVNKFIDCAVTVAVAAGQNRFSEAYVTRSTEAVAAGALSLQKTVKINFGNNAVVAVSGYNVMNGTDDDLNDTVINLVEDDGVTNTGWTLKNAGVANWSSADNGDTTNATTGDLQSDILTSYHSNGGNNEGNAQKELSNLDSSRFYTVKIVSVATSLDTVNYDTFWKANGLDGDTIPVTIDPVANRTTPVVETICTQIAPTAGGVLYITGYEPGSDQIYINSMIIEEYA